jgi:hypothetical protein
MNAMTRLLPILLLCLACGSAAAAPIKVFILAGQSNAGGGIRSTPPAPLDGPQASLFQYKIQTNDQDESTDWGPLRPLIGQGEPGWGTELSFAKAMEQRSGAPIAIIKTTVNGSNLWGQWLPSANNLYPWMMTKINSSLSQLTALGYQPDLSGFLWIQGEGDANILANAQVYDENLASLASALRFDLGTPNLPFILNEAHVNLARPLGTSLPPVPAPTSTVQALRESQQNAADLDPNMYMVNFDDLPLGPDYVHWTSETHLELGRRFADVLMPSGDFNDDGLVSAADLPVWTGAAGANRAGDANADGASDGNDFLLWQRQIGVGTTPLASTVAAIPEPRTVCCVAEGLIVGSRIRRRVRRRWRR